MLHLTIQSLCWYELALDYYGTATSSSFEFSWSTINFKQTVLFCSAIIEVSTSVTFGKILITPDFQKKVYLGFDV